MGGGRVTPNLKGATSGGRATDERVTCLRIFADGNGETHMEDMDITLQPKKLFKDTPPLGLTENLPASWYNICYVPKGTWTKARLVGRNGLAPPG